MKRSSLILVSLAVVGAVGVGVGVQEILDLEAFSGTRNRPTEQMFDLHAAAPEGRSRLHRDTEGYSTAEIYEERNEEDSYQDTVKETWLKRFNRAIRRSGQSTK